MVASCVITGTGFMHRHMLQAALVTIEKDIIFRADSGGTQCILTDD